MTVNGVNGANLLTRQEAIALYKGAKIANYSEDDIQRAMLSGRVSQGPVDSFQNSGDNAAKQVELTPKEQDIKAGIISDVLPKKIKSNADYLGLIQELQKHQNILADPEVQAALKAKKLELNPPPPKPKYQSFANDAEHVKLKASKTSGETIDLQIAAEKTKQAIQKYVPTIEIEQTKDIKANHGSVVQQFIDVAVDGKTPKGNAESLQNIAGTKLTADQKATLKGDLEAIKNMDLATLASEFGIKLDDLEKLEDLKVNLNENPPVLPTNKDVKAQLDLVNGLLAQIEGSEANGKNPATGLAKVRADRAAADKNIANNNKMIASS